GLFKKAFLADNLNTIINEIGRPDAQSNRMLLTLAVVLYGFRILLDFAGYSDIAIGSARLFGIKVPENFLYPYRQRNIADFWRHWHVSLSSWLTDYVFISVGGSRYGIKNTLRNLMLVMVVSGFWHGAAWNFVLWGIWHGILLTSHRMYKEFVYPKLPSAATHSFAANAISYVVTMVAVWFGWLLFMWPMDEVMIYLRAIAR
ncbi:MAG TPA: MBOAT family O-acyltransferase, partial [Fimbriimonas sp.]